jgi:hypothetical protein
MPWKVSEIVSERMEGRDMFTKETANVIIIASSGKEV